MATIYDVAKKSGCSITTVSRALNNYSDINATTKENILKVCKELNYMPSSSARSLSTKRSGTIGVIFSEILGLGITHPFFSGVIENFRRAIEGQGYDLLFISKEIGDSTYSYIDHCKYRNIDGVIVVNAVDNDSGVLEIIKSTIPVVLIDNPMKGASSVSSDNRAGVQQAIDYLVQLGHSRIAHISGNHEAYATKVRKEAFINAMERHSLAIPEGYIEEGGYFSEDGGFLAMQKMLALPKRPTAVFAAGDAMAVGAIRAIREQGLSVPQDISVIGFDDIEIARFISPSLTTVRQDSIALGRTAAELLLSYLDKDREYENNPIPVELVCRESVGPPPE